MAHSDHFVWAPPDRAVSVHLSAEAVRRIETRLPDASAATRPLEDGGLLLGRVREVNDSWIVSVESVEFAHCEHARGESWTLSRSDRHALVRLVAKYRSRGVVGFFRTHTRPGLFLDEHDVSLFRDLFHHPAAVALAVRPDATATFFVWQNGEVERHQPHETFVCRSSALGLEAGAATPVEAPPGRRGSLLWIPAAAAVAVAAFWQPPVEFGGTERRRVPAAVERPVFAPPEEPVVRPASHVPAEPVASVPVWPKPPVVAPPRVVARAEPPKPNVVRRAVGSVPGLGFLKREKATPPVATRTVTPATFRDEFPVKVKVKIGSDGIVRSARLLTDGARADTIESVMRAARGWRFQPARDERRAVESELVLTFQPR